MNTKSLGVRNVENKKQIRYYIRKRMDEENERKKYILHTLRLK